MSSHKPYHVYKDSGIDWFPEMPFEWNSIKVKHIFGERVEKGFPNEPLLAATQTKGVVRKEEYENTTVTAQKDFHLLKLVRVGDFVISLRSFQGGIEIAHQKGIISPAYTIMVPDDNIDKEYFKHLFKSKYFVDGLTTFVTGIREGQNIDYSKFRRSFLPFPPKPEQTAIAQFLDLKTAEIKTFIELKVKTIALLKERKTAIINQAITKGLDHNVEMKESGIEWLGEIPKHWEVKKVKFLFQIAKRIVGKLGFDVLSITQGGIKIKDITSGEGQLSMDYSKYQLIEPGDFGMNHMDLLTGYVDVSKYRGVVSPDYRVFQSISNLADPSYYLNLFQMGYKNKIFFAYGQGSSQLGRWRLPADAFKNFKVPLPPKDEQQEIMEFINTGTNEYDIEIDKILQEIALIKEYQHSLISETVTGKIDVRDYEYKELTSELNQL